jgi:bifunctional enzyme CysN/CysC
MTTPDLPDQRNLWSRIYGEGLGTHEHGSGFARECLARLPVPSHILELGCGTGGDAEGFARAGHTVVATDFVEATIARNQARLRDLPNLRFQVMRNDAPYPFADGTFDAAYAHLTLHYFRHDINVAIFAEIRRVLKQGGWLMFACKSPHDPLYGKGKQVEADMFVYPNGQVRHFFSEAYARRLLAGEFTDVEVTAHRGTLFGDNSAWITVIARVS